MTVEEKEMISCPACGHTDYEEKFKVSEKMANFTNTYPGELVCPICRRKLRSIRELGDQEEVKK